MGRASKVLRNYRDVAHKRARKHYSALVWMSTVLQTLCIMVQILYMQLVAYQLICNDSMKYNLSSVIFDLWWWFDCYWPISNTVLALNAFQLKSLIMTVLPIMTVN